MTLLVHPVFDSISPTVGVLRQRRRACQSVCISCLCRMCLWLFIRRYQFLLFLWCITTSSSAIYTFSVASSVSKSHNDYCQSNVILETSSAGRPHVTLHRVGGIDAPSGCSNFRSPPPIQWLSIAFCERREPKKALITPRLCRSRGKKQFTRNKWFRQIQFAPQPPVSPPRKNPPCSPPRAQLPDATGRVTTSPAARCPHDPGGNPGGTNMPSSVYRSQQTPTRFGRVVRQGLPHACRPARLKTTAAAFWGYHARVNRHRQHC